ncbi:MAG: YihY/virulence factor BrkB family protein [Pseudomonadota bacterium]
MARLSDQDTAERGSAPAGPAAAEAEPRPASATAGGGAAEGAGLAAWIARARRGAESLWAVRLVATAWRRFVEDNSFALAGYLAYTGLLSFFPFMITIVVTGSYIVGLEESLQLVDQAFALTPPQVAETLQPVFLTIIESKTGFLALVSAAVGLWAGSNAFEAARIGFNLAYDVREDRHFVRRRLQSLALAGTAAVVFVSLGFLIVLWPLIAGLISAGAGGMTSAGFDAFYVLRYAIGLPMLYGLLLALHLTLPKGARVGGRLRVHTEHGETWLISVAPGVAVSVVIWILGATAFSLYLRYAPSFAGNYGAMAGVVITLLFFYMSSIVIFFGAQINIAAEELRRNRRLKSGGHALSDDAAVLAAEAEAADILRLRRKLEYQG